MEIRRNMAADALKVGAVYIEEDSGSDLHGDTFQVLFEGGATGTQLERLVIDTDHGPLGMSVGDLIFDKVKGGLGADEAFNLQIVSSAGIDNVQWQVTDGGTKLAFDFVGFHAGEKLVFSIDVDEVQDYDPSETNLDRINESIDPITSGVEFQGSELQSTFVAPGYFDVAGEAEFRNLYDPLFLGSSLLRTESRPDGLPDDNYQGRRDRSTGALLPLQQHPKPVSIRGHVRLTDREGNCDGDSPEVEAIPDVLVTLLDDAGNVLKTTRTNAAGEYAFEGLAPGKYTVVETTPADLLDGDEHVGTVGAATRGQIGGNDTLREIDLGPGEDGFDYDFCEHLPGEIAGYVYHDLSNDGKFDPKENPLANVTVELQDGSGKFLDSTTTDTNGYYRFGGLAAGTYRVVEKQPAVWSDGLDTPGTIRGITVGQAHNPGDMLDQIDLLWGDSGVEYNFGEVEFARSQLSGYVFRDPDADCLFDEGELALADVVVELLNAQGDVLRSTRTDSAGYYHFDDLPAGTYGVREVQPVGLFHGGQVAGSNGGNADVPDLISGIAVGSGQTLTQYNFCETPPASIAGFVFRDGPTIFTLDGKAPANLATIRDGKLTMDDERLAGVVLELRKTFDGRAVTGDETLPGSNPTGPLRAVTDSTGYYRFDGLRMGDYTVVELQPQDYIDSLDTAGTLGGLPINPHAMTPELEALITGFTDNGINLQSDAILRISLGRGQASEFNNFSEVLVSPTLIPPKTPPKLTDPPPKAVIPPFIQPTPLEFIPTPQTEELVSGRASRGFTWHLSMIDGGNPRVTKTTTRLNGSVWKPASALDRSAWRAEYAADGEWLIRVGDVKKYRFGMPGATPVAGDFNGDGHADLGVFLDGEWFLDLNGNGRWDEGDLCAKLGGKKDRPVVGDWDGDGKDDIGIYGPEWVGDLRHIEAEPGVPDVANQAANKLADHKARRPKNVPPDHVDATSGERLLKATAAGDERADLIDHVFRFGQPTDQPIAGDWNGDGIASIGIFRNGKWLFDNDGDGRWSEGDQVATFGQAEDRPVVGDWDGDGKDQIGVYRGGEWVFDSNGNQQLDDADQRLQLGQPGHVPIVGDWNGDGTDEPGLYREVEEGEDASAETPAEE